MSVKALGMVWELELPPRELVVLLALTDHADDYGGNMFPSLAYVAWKVGTSTDTVRRSIRRMVKAGFLNERKRPGKTTVYSVQWDACPRKQPFNPLQSATPSKVLPLASHEKKPKATPSTPSAKLKHEPSIDNHQTTTTVAVVENPASELPAESTAPERPNVYGMYERQFGMLLSPGIADTLKDMATEYGEDWVNDALSITATSGKSGNLRYTAAILRNWKVDGKNDDRSKSNPVVDELTAWRAAQKARPNVLLDAALDMVLPAFKDEDDRRRYIEDYLQIDYTPLMSKESAS